jgi:hypothetical protein
MAHMTRVMCFSMARMTHVSLSEASLAQLRNSREAVLVSLCTECVNLVATTQDANSDATADATPAMPHERRHSRRQKTKAVACNTNGTLEKASGVKKLVKATAS